jgi:signal transduction histidine kinase/CheY-like chemotaxis protein
MSIRARLFLAFSLCLSLACGSIAFIVFTSAEESANEAFRVLAVSRLQGVEERINTFLEPGIMSVNYLAKLDLVRNSRGKLTDYLDTSATTTLRYVDHPRYEQRIYDEFIRVARYNDNFGLVFMANDDGQYAQAPEGHTKPPAYDPRLRSWYVEGMRSGQKVSVSSPYLTSGGGMVCSIMIRTEDLAGRPLGLLGVDYSLQSLIADLDAQRILKTGYIVVFDAEGRILADGHHPEYAAVSRDIYPDLRKTMADAPDDVLTGVGERGIEEYIVTHTMRLLGWKLAVVFEKNELLSSSYYLLRTTLVAFGLILLIVIGVTAVIAGSIVRPIEKLVEAATVISSGDYETSKTVRENLRKSLSLTGSGEIKKLAEALSTVIYTLQQRIEAEQATKAKTKFLAKMSHEIRTPLNSIIGMTEILIRKINTKEIYQELYEFASIIKQSGTSLLVIINDILDFSKIESGSLQLNKSKYLFTSLLNDVINIANVQIVEYKTINFIVHVDVDIPAELIGDESRVRQIFVNILSNAVKYTNSGSITLNVALLESNADEVTLTLTVKDTGIGIKEEDQQTIFSEFKRVDDKINQKTEGTGLGLAIVRDLCRMMHGDIALYSVYGSGSEFTATIRQQAASTKKLAAVTDPGRRRVLLFKDEDARHASIVSALRELGLPEPKTTETLREFSEAFAGGIYDYAFIPARSAREYFRSHALPGFETRREKSTRTKLVVMVKMGEISDIPGALDIMLPVYCVPLANVLNDVSGALSPERSVRDANGLLNFSAPNAAVLVVDDVPTNLRVAKEFLAFYDISAETCADGADAPAKAASRHYDLIFMDHMMPGVDGVEAVRRIRELGGGGGDADYFRTVPIVALTANAVVGQKEMFLEHGFNDFLSKPIEPQALDAILEKWLPPEKRRPADVVIRGAKAGVLNDVQALQPWLAAGLDVEKGIAGVGGRKAAYAGVLAVFRQDGETLVPRLREAAAAGDLAAYASAAHALKGSLRTIGAGQLADSAMRLEQAALAGDSVLPGKETQPFLEALQTLIGIFDQVISALTARKDAGRASATNEALPRTLTLLKDALNAGDIPAVDALLEECRGMELAPDQRALINEIEMSVIVFEYGKAGAIIDTLSASSTSRLPICRPSADDAV